MAGENNLLKSIAGLSKAGPIQQLAHDIPKPVYNPVEGIAEAKKKMLGSVAEAKKQALDFNPKTPKNEFTVDDFVRQIAEYNQGTEAGKTNYFSQVAQKTSRQLGDEFGVDPYLMAERINEASRIYRDLYSASRTGSEMASDTINQIGKGAADTVENLAALGRQVISEPLGLTDTWLDAPSKAIQKGAEWVGDALEDRYSDNYQKIQQRNDLDVDVRAVESKRIADEALASGEQGPWEAALRRVGRDVLSAGQGMIDNPALIGGMLAENAASLAGGAVVTRQAAKQLVKQNLKRQGYKDDVIDQFLDSEKGRDLVMKRSVLMQPAASGIEEAGAGVTEIQKEFDQIPVDKIVSESPRYKELVEGGLSQEDAISKLRSELSSETALTRFGLGYLLGNLSKQFEAAPLSGGIGSLVPNMAGEAVEEAGMGGGGEVAKNIMMQEKVDPETDLVDGVGRGIAEGAIVGSAMVGAAQGPRAALETADAAARADAALTKKAVGAVKGAVTSRLDARKQAQVDADSATSEAALAEGKVAAEEALDAAEMAVAEAPVEAPEGNQEEGTPEGTESAEAPAETPEQAAVKTIRQAYKVAPEELPERIRNLVADENGEIPESRTDLMIAINRKFATTEDPTEKLHMAAAMAEQVSKLGSINNEDTVQTVGSLPDDSPVKAAHGQMTSFIQGFIGSPNTQSIRDYIVNNAADIDTALESLTEETDDAEIAETLTSVAKVQEQAPDQADPDKLSDVLDMARKRNIKLPEDVVNTIQSVIDISKVAKLHAEVYESNPILDPETESREGMRSSDVRQQIFTTSWRQTQDSTEAPAGSRKRSMAQYVTDIREAMKTGKQSVAQNLMQNMTNFAITNQNKLKAMDESSKSGKRHAYEFFDPDSNQWYMSDEARGDQVSQYGAPTVGVIHKAKDPQKVRNSHNLYRQIFADATAMTAIQQTMAAEFPELGIEPLKFTPSSISISRNQGIFELKQLGELGEAVLKNRQGRKPKQTAPATVPTTVPTTTTSTPPATTGKPPASTKPKGKTSAQSQSQAATQTPPATTGSTGPAAGTTEEVKPRDIKEVFKESVEPEFYEYYKDDPKSKSIIKDEPEPARAVYKMLAPKEGESQPASLALLRNVIKNEVHKLTKGVAENLSAAWASEAVKNPKKPATDAEKKQWRNLRSTVFTSLNEKGERVLDPRVGQAAALAAISVASEIAPKHRIDIEEAMDKMGIKDSFDVENPDIKRFLKYNEAGYKVRDDITRRAFQILGLRITDDALESSSRGAMDSLAQEMMQILTNEGILQQNDITITDIEGRPRSFLGYQLGPKFSDQNKTDLNQSGDLLTEMIFPEGQKKFYLGSPPADDVLRRNVKGSQDRLSGKQWRAVRHSSNIAHTLNTEFLTISDAIGEQNMAAMRGYIEITDHMRNTYNVNRLASIEGKNQTIMSEIEEVKELRKRLANTEKGDATEIFFPHEVTRVGRTQASGPASGQSNKYARAAVRSTWADLDLKDNAQHKEGFWRTILQMSGTKLNGKKIERNSRAEIMGLNKDGIPHAEAAIREKYAPVISEIQKILEGKEEFDLQTIMSLDQGTEPVVIEALAAVAKYDIAKKKGKLKNFRHSVPLEADGVTNGPAAVLVKFSTAMFSPEELANYERVGYYFTPIRDEEGNLIPRTLDTQRVDRDLYEVAKDVSKTKLEERRALLQTNTTSARIEESVSRFLLSFNPLGVSAKLEEVDSEVLEDVAETIMTWELDRNATKNPLTKTTYGAGKMGTARGILNESLEKFYQAVSEWENSDKSQTLEQFVGYPEGESLVDDLKTMTGQYFHTSMTGRIGKLTDVNSKIKGISGKNIDAKSITIEGAAFEAMAENVNTVYVHPLYEAVEVTMGSSFRNMKHVIAAASIQSSVLTALHRRMIAAFPRGVVPSPADQKLWMERFKRLGARIETPHQVFSIGGPQDRYLYKYNPDGSRDLKNVSSSIDRKLNIGFRGDVPGPAGVGAAAYINIGTGDGYTMMDLLSMDPEEVFGLDRVLQIYDGLEMPADAFSELGEAVNKSAYAAWQADTMKGVLDSFQNFMREFNDIIKNDDKGNLDENMLLEIHNDIQPMFKQESSYSEDIYDFIEDKISSINNELKRIHKGTRLKAQARKAFWSSVDQMAGAGSPYVNQGPVAGETLEEAAEALNAKMAELAEREKAKPEEYYRKNAALSAAMRQRGENMGDNRVQLIGMDMGPMMKHMSRESRELYDTFIKPYLSPTIEIYFGPRDELESFRVRAYDSKEVAGMRPIPENGGQYDPYNDVIYIVEPENTDHLGETVMHELTHAVLAHKIFQYYKDPTLMPEVHRDAMLRIETMVDDFLDLNFSRDNEEVRERVQALRSLRDSEGLRGHVVNEVVAEILTNPALRTVAKQQKVSNPVVRITRNIIKAIKDLFPMFKKKYVNESYFDHMLFNVEVLNLYPIGPMPYGRGSLRDPKATGDNLNMERRITGDNSPGSRAQRTSSLVQQGVNRVLRSMGADTSSEIVDLGENVVFDKSTRTLDAMIQAGFDFNTQERTAFLQSLNIFMADAPVNGAVLARAQEVYEHVMDKLTYRDFMAEGVIPGGQEEADAREKYDALIGLHEGFSKDIRGRDLGLPLFLALANSNEEFANVLSKYDLPRKHWKKASTDTTVDDFLSENTQAALDYMTSLVVGENRGSDAAKAAKNLMDRIANLEMQKASSIEATYQNAMDYVNDKAVAILDKNSTEYSKKMREYAKTIDNNYLKLPIIAAQMAVSIFSEKESKRSAERLTLLANQLPQVLTPITELMAEMRGRTDDNAKIYDMINITRKSIASIREKFRDSYPDQIQEQFTRKLTKSDWKTLQIGIGMTDVAVLLGSKSYQQIAKMFRSAPTRKAEITKLSAGLSQDQIDMADRLADFMVNRTTKNDVNLPGLRSNAYAIMAMAGKYIPGGRDDDGNRYDSELILPENADAMTQQLDELITLMAIDKMPQPARKTMVDLLTNEQKGMKYTLAQMGYFRAQEQLKTEGNPTVLMNQWKGYIPNESAAGVDVIIEKKDAKTHARLAYMGYERISDYESAYYDPDHKGLAIYRSVVAGKNTYTQGVMQTVQQSQNGVDTRTGRDVSGLTSGRITGADARGIKAAGNLRPVLNFAGEIVAYERLLPPAALEKKNLNNHFGDMLGAMAGRQIEEAKAREFNEELVVGIKEQYDYDVKRGRKGEYIDIAKSKDKIHQDTWNNVPRDMKDHLRKVFGPNSFPVRADMIPMAVGYRNPGISDLWTGTSRLPDNFREQVREFVTRIMGRKAYEYLKKAENFYLSTIAEAKVIIVVKSIVVPVRNFISNIGQLMSLGVPLRTIFTQGINKFHEINAYLANREKQIRLNADLRATDDPLVQRSIKAKLAAIKATNERMSIWPLLQRGEFQTISEGLQEVDVAFREGKLAEWIEQKVEQLPEGVKTLGRYAVVSKTTSLYKGLNRSVQFGDFLAKAILYDDLVNRQKLNQAEAFGVITQEFVNYNVPPGRLRTGLESFGLTWFWSYKLRSLKPALRAIRTQPARLVMAMGTYGATDVVGLPIEDNVATVIAQGRAPFSLGWESLFRAPELLPWANIADSVR